MTRPLAHPAVAAAVGAYLEAVDREAPGLVEGLYLTGSAALGDFRPRTSDVDFVAVTGCPLGAADFAALARTHQRLAASVPRPFFDGIYVTWDDLARDPARRRGPHSHEGKFHVDASGPGDPVTWHTVAHYGVACRGPDPKGVTIWTNRQALASWTLNNLDGYWRGLLRRAARRGDLWSVVSLTAYGAVWIPLGVSRLHYTLATGDICSKDAAGCYALDAFPGRWHGVVEESLRIRRTDRARPDVASALTEMMAHLRLRRGGALGPHYVTPIARRRDVLAFGEMVVTDAERRYGRRSG